MNVNDKESTQNLPADYARNAEISPQGRLSDRSSRALIDRLHQIRFTGRLTLSYREKRKKVWFFEGEIFRIQSNLAPELFGQLMIEKTWMSEADLKKCLEIQRLAKEPKSLGDMVQEIYGIKARDIDLLYLEQKARGLFQALTWVEGDYEIAAMDLKPVEKIGIQYEDFIFSVRALLETSQRQLGYLFNIVRPWKPKAGGVNLAEFPVWTILAGCRLAGSSGILSIRKQNRLHEIVIKQGAPLTLYEGTFGQPRQTIVVRQASDEHEKFFVEQLFKLFSFLTGAAHFRPLGGDERSATNLNEPVENTAVLNENSAVELTSHFLAKSERGPNAFLKRILNSLKKKMIKMQSHLEKGHV